LTTVRFALRHITSAMLLVTSPSGPMPVAP
jgi:hypothetical protein